MAERKHPKEFHKPGTFRFRWRRGCIPWLSWVGASPFYDEFQYRHRWVDGLVGGLDVLGIPCGVGWGTSIMKSAKSIEGLDISEEAIREAQKLYPGAGEFRVGDMGALDYPEGSLFCNERGIQLSLCH